MAPETKAEKLEAERLEIIKDLCIQASNNPTINKTDRALYRMIAGIADGSVQVNR